MPVTGKPVESSPPANTEGKVESFEKVGTNNGVGNISNNENVGKRTTKV